MSEFIKFWFSVCPEGEYLEVRPLRSSFGQKWFTEPTQASEYIARAAQAGDVYVGCLPRVRQSGKAEDVTARRRLLFVDLDCGAAQHHQHGYATVDQALAAVAPWAPAAVVHSGNGVHCWWVLEADARPGEWQDAERRLAHHLRADMAATDAPRILRPPPSLNHKTKPPRPVELLELHPERRLSIQRVLELPAAPPPPRKPGRPPTKQTTGRPFDVCNDVPVSQVLDWLGVPMNNQGERVYCACPVHRGTNPTQMLVGGARNVATCYGDCSGTAYTSVDLTAAARAVSPAEAVKQIIERFDLKPQVRAVAPGDAGNWRSRLKRTAPRKDEDGNPVPGGIKTTLANVMLVLTEAPEYHQKLRFNSMTQMPEFDGVEIADSDITLLREELENHHDMAPGKEMAWEAVTAIAKDREYHPVQQYLGCLEWDGVERIKHVPRDVLHAEDSQLARRMVASWFVSAVKRAMEPGCKVDTSLVLVGRQGAYKSTFFKNLAGEFFVDTAIDISNKDAYLQIAGAWIYEWPEIEAVVRGKSWGQVKAFMSTSTDIFRPPYGKANVRLPRASVIVGTTNEQTFLGDPTGSRRFWTLAVGAIDAAYALRSRDQLWAEAVQLYRGGERWWLEPGEDEAREEKAESFAEGDPWDEVVAAWVARPGAVLTTSSILGGAVGIEPRFQDPKAQRRVGSLMRRLGYAQATSRVDGKPTRVWRQT